MSVPIYLDNNVSPRIADGLRRRGVTAVHAVEDGRAHLQDEALLEHATNLGFLLYTQDDDFLEITARWSRAGRSYAGLAFSKHAELPIGKIIEDLELIAKVHEALEVHDRRFFLPF